MLSKSILKTIQYFDVQDHCLTLLEVFKYLLSDGEETQNYSLSEILESLENDLAAEVEELNGFYFLGGRSELVKRRLENNLYATPRLKRIKKYAPFLRFIPFISAVALTGSEAINNSKKGSDIDLLVLTKKNRIWLGRVALSVFFQVFGVRRHGHKVADRFCLNHYVEEGKEIQFDKNIYTAIEYTSLIPLSGAEKIYEFQMRNLPWLKQYLAQPQIVRYETRSSSILKRSIEMLFANPLGDIIEKSLGYLQRHKIKLGEYIVVEPDELSFHPGSKGQQVLARFRS